MKCKKCGYENAKKINYCVKCGNMLKNNNNKKIKILIILLLLILVLGLVLGIFLKNKNVTLEDPFADIQNINSSSEYIKDGELVNSVKDTLRSLYEQNKITADTYIKELAYSIFDVSKLNSAYQNLENEFPDITDLYKNAALLVDDLSKETIMYLIDQAYLSNISIESNSQNLPQPTAVDKNVKKLNKVVLSSKGNFLIYYTDNGINATDKAYVQKAADFLEELVLLYEKKYNMKYEYTYSAGINNTSSAFYSILLKINNIDPSYLKTAMPVYMLNTDNENTGILGYYFPNIETYLKILLRIFNPTDIDEDIKTSYTLPFFVVNSAVKDFDSTKIILAHELFHHYQKYICGDGKYISDCESGDFTEETTANLAATQNLNINSTNKVFNSHAKQYILDSENSINKVCNANGYCSFVFAYNYASIVENGTNLLFQSIKEKDPLKYLYENSNGKYKNVLLTLAEKNLTHDYENKLLIPEVDNKIYIPKNYLSLTTKDFKKTIDINYSSMHYYYVDPKKYNDNTQLIIDADENTSILFFIKKGDKYNYLHKQDLNEKFIITIDDYKRYEEIAFAIVNQSLNDTKYNIEIANNSKITPSVTLDSLNLNEDFEVKDKNSYICEWEEYDDTLNKVYQLKIGFDNKNKINELYLKGTLILNDYEENKVLNEISKKITTVMVNALAQKYKKELKYTDMKINDLEDRYTILIRVNKDYERALKNSFDVVDYKKTNIIKKFINDGYNCY